MAHGAQATTHHLDHLTIHVGLDEIPEELALRERHKLVLREQTVFDAVDVDVNDVAARLVQLGACEAHVLLSQVHRFDGVLRGDFEALDGLLGQGLLGVRGNHLLEVTQLKQRQCVQL